MPKKRHDVVEPGQQSMASIFPQEKKRKATSLRGTQEGPLAKKSRVVAAPEAKADAPATRRQLQEIQSSKKRELRPRPAPQACLRGAPRQEQNNPSSSQSKKPAAVPASKPKKQVALTHPKVLQRMKIQGDMYKVGDDVYLIATDDLLSLPDDTCEDLCVKCGKGQAAHTIVECEHCLGGYHMGCLRPKLTKIPEGIWTCPCCARGEPKNNRPLRTAYEKYLFAPVGQEVLQLARITSFAKDRSHPGSLEVCVRYYCRPEATHVGRLPDHATREVFLTSCEHWEDIECVFSSAYVCSPQDFEKQTGTEVYMCEYEYDEQWKRFRRFRSASNRRSASGIESKGRAKACGATDDVLDDLRDGSDGDGSSEDDGSDFDADQAEPSSSSSSSSDDDEDVAKDVSFNPKALWGRSKPQPKKGKALPRSRLAPHAAAAQTGPLNKRAALLELGDQGEEALLQLVGRATGSASVPSRAPLHPLAAARRALSLASVPASLQCRDEEKLHITRFVQEAVEEGLSPGVLYVCGVPGTGKTALISQVLKDVMQQQHQQRQQQQQQQSPRKAHAGFADAPGVQVVSLNALSLPSPLHVYSKLWERLMGQRLGPGRALAALEQLFSSGGDQPRGGRACMTLLVVDEIDVLITKDQSVLYNLFEWPMRPGARLTVIGISNTHDLDDRVLPRISSRLASAKLAFSPYKVDDLVAIMHQRLQLAGCRDLFEDSSLLFAARKVAASTGDVRRALELLRRSAELAEAKKARFGVDLSNHNALKKAVGMSEVIAAQKEMYETPYMQFLRVCSRLEKLVLGAIIMELRASSKDSAQIQAVLRRLTTHVLLMCPLEGPRPHSASSSVPSSQPSSLPPNPLGIPSGSVGSGTLCRIIFGLASQRLVMTGPSWQGINANVALQVHKDDVATVIQEDPSLATLHAQL